MSEQVLSALCRASRGSALAAPVPAFAGTDSESGSLAAVAVGISDVEWAGGGICMAVPVTLAVTTLSSYTSWSGNLGTGGHSAYFTGRGSTQGTISSMELCKTGAHPGLNYLSGYVTVQSSNPYRTEQLYLSASFTLNKARTKAVITSVRRSYGQITLNGYLLTEAGNPPGTGFVRVQAKKPGTWAWRTISSNYGSHIVESRDVV